MSKAKAAGKKAGKKAGKAATKKAAPKKPAAAKAAPPKKPAPKSKPGEHAKSGVTKKAAVVKAKRAAKGVRNFEGYVQTLGAANKTKMQAAAAAYLKSIKKTKTDLKKENLVLLISPKTKKFSTGPAAPQNNNQKRTGAKTIKKAGAKANTGKAKAQRGRTRKAVGEVYGPHLPRLPAPTEADHRAAVGSIPPRVRAARAKKAQAAVGTVGKVIAAPAPAAPGDNSTSGAAKMTSSQAMFG